MPTLKNNENIDLTLQDGTASCMNVSGTCKEIGTPLTQPYSDFVPTPESRGAMAALDAKASAQGAVRFFDAPIDVRRALMAKGRAAGWNTPAGHAISNLIEILQNLFEYDRPAWATHETQTLPYRMNYQMKCIEAAQAASR